MISIETAPLVDEGGLPATSAFEPPSEGDSLQHDRTLEPPAQKGADAFPIFEGQANDPIEELSDGPDVNDLLSSVERQDPGSPAQSAIAKKIYTGVEAAAPLVRKINDPDYFPPDRANVLPESDNGKPEDDETDAATDELASSQTDSVVVRPSDLDVTPAPGPETPANAKTQARPKRSSRKTSPNTEGASKRAANQEAKAKAQRAQAEKVEAIVRDILTKQSRIGKNARANIPLWVAIGVDLIRLKREAGKGWLKRARELGYHPRQASRYQKLGETWGDTIRPIGSDLLAKLPADLKVLERICQIPVEQLGDFLGAKENAEAIEGSDGKPSRWDRNRLAAEVDAWIGAAPRPPRPPSPEQIVRSFERVVSKTASALQRSNTEGVSFNELRARLHGVLDKAIDQLEVPSGPETIGSARISPE
jgi:hypothetical protein